MAHTVAQLAARCLSYSNFGSGDSANFPAGTTLHLSDAITGALGDIKRAAPGLFRRPLGGVLAAKVTTTAAVVNALATVTLGASGAVNMNTLRITGGKSDYTIFAVSGTSGTISPAWEGTTGTFDCTRWNDSWLVNAGAAYQDGDVSQVKVNGVLIEQVGNRGMAESLWGTQNNYSQSQASERAETTTDIPRYWWLERYLANTYVMFYPMPAVSVNVEALMTVGAGTVDASTVLTSDETFNLPDDVSGDIFRPLVIGRWRQSPMMANVKVETEVQRQTELAMAWLAKATPRKPLGAALCDPGVPEPGLAPSP